MTHQVTVDEVITAPKRLGRWLAAEATFILRVLYSSCDRFYWDNGFSRAASLAYTSLLSLLPFIAVAFGVLASFAVSRDYIPGLQTFIFHYFVPTQELADQVNQFLTDFSDRISALSVPMIASFVLTSLLLVNAVEAALNETWQVYITRPITHRIAIFCAILLISPVLALSVYIFVQLRLQPFILTSDTSHTVTALYNHLLPFFLVFGVFLFLYYMVPKAPVRFRSAVFGAAFTAVLFSLAYEGFAMYIEKYASYNKIYGAIAAIPIFLVWLYLFWAIVLLGAETAYQVQYLPRTGKLLKRSLLSVGEARFVLAMQALVVIARAFRDGGRMPDDQRLSEDLGCSSLVLRPALASLEKARIIVRGESPQGALSLLRHPDKITVEEIQQALFGQDGGSLFCKEIRAAYASIADNEGAATMSLSQIVDAHR